MVKRQSNPTVLYETNGRVYNMAERRTNRMLLRYVIRETCLEMAKVPVELSDSPAGLRALADAFRIAKRYVRDYKIDHAPQDINKLDDMQL